MAASSFILPPFKIERYFARYEFSAPYLLCCSDCEPLLLPELLSMAEPNDLLMWDEQRLGYTDSHGEPLLRNEIVTLYRTLTPDNCLVVTPVEGIFIALNVLLKKGDHCIVTFPGYQSLYEVARSIGCDVSYWEPVEDKGWYFDVDHLASLITPHTKALIINFPHNPTGSTITKEQLEAIVALARAHSLTIFSDEMYRGLEKDDTQTLPSVADLYENGLVLSGMSKSFGLPGLRIGWLASQNKEFLDACLIFKDYITICASGPSQILSLIALKAQKKILDRNRDIITHTSAAFAEFVSHHSDCFSWHPPKAGSIAFVRYHGSDGVTALAKKLLDAEGIMILPSTVFEYHDAHWRLGLGRKNVPEILDRLDRFMRKL